jgi:hypothetical protein
MKKEILFALLCCQLTAFAQSNNFPTNPSKAKFITSDLPNFWTAFDSIGKSNKNPFEYYIKRGSAGLQDFVPNRIMGADSLLSMVSRRKADYELKRGIESQIKEQEKLVAPYFRKLKKLYPNTKFPPVYFVFGRFNSGGTSQPSGLIIGAEMLNDLKGLPNLVIHESIHFQQIFPDRETTLLEQSVLEGSASFIAALITNSSEDSGSKTYMEKHKDLFSEFISRMNGTNTDDWLYGTTKKDDRPNDLGYWMGYKISEAYYNKVKDKKAAINQILNVKDYSQFLKASGYMDEYLKPTVN